MLQEHIAAINGMIEDANKPTLRRIDDLLEAEKKATDAAVDRIDNAAESAAALSRNILSKTDDILDKIPKSINRLSETVTSDKDDIVRSVKAECGKAEQTVSDVVERQIKSVLSRTDDVLELIPKTAGRINDTVTTESAEVVKCVKNEAEKLMKSIAESEERLATISSNLVSRMNTIDTTVNQINIHLEAERKKTSGMLSVMLIINIALLIAIVLQFII